MNAYLHPPSCFRKTCQGWLTWLSPFLCSVINWWEIKMYLDNNCFLIINIVVSIFLVSRLRIFMQLYIFINTNKTVEYRQRPILDILCNFGFYVNTIYFCIFKVHKNTQCIGINYKKYIVLSLGGHENFNNSMLWYKINSIFSCANMNVWFNLTFCFNLSISNKFPLKLAPLVSIFEQGKWKEKESDKDGNRYLST